MADRNVRPTRGAVDVQQPEGLLMQPLTGLMAASEIGGAYISLLKLAPVILLLLIFLRLTTWIDRADMSRSRSDLYAPTEEPTLEIPPAAWTPINLP